MLDVVLEVDALNHTRHFSYKRYGIIVIV